MKDRYREMDKGSRQPRKEREMSLEILRFAVNMQQELDNNDYKTGWENLSPSWIIHRIKQETKELEKAIKEKHLKRKIISECADIANFVMMLADNIRNGIYDDW